MWTLENRVTDTASEVHKAIEESRRAWFGRVSKRKRRKGFVITDMA